MNCDEISLRLMRSFYDDFAKSPESIDKYYAPEAKLVVTIDGKDSHTCVSERFGALIAGDRELYRSNGQSQGELIMAHVSGCILISPEECYQSNEMIVYGLRTEPFIIYHHSINLSKMDKPPPPKKVEAPAPPPTPKPEPKPAPKPAPKPVPEKKGPVRIEQSQWKSLFAGRTVLAENIPFSRNPEEILPEFEPYGAISRYCSVKGKILIEYVNPAAVKTVFEDGDFRWCGRMIRINQMPASFSDSK